MLTTLDMKLKTGVYYFNKEKDSGNLIIEKEKIEIKEDDFLIFDSKLNHYSEPNENKKERIVFSINMGYKVKTTWKEDSRSYIFL